MPIRISIQIEIGLSLFPIVMNKPGLKLSGGYLLNSRDSDIWAGFRVVGALRPISIRQFE